METGELAKHMEMFVLAIVFSSKENELQKEHSDAGSTVTVTTEYRSTEQTC